MRDILLIIPAYNEEKSIVKTVDWIRKFNKNHRRKVDYIVIDDGSTDDTERLLKLNRIPTIRLDSNSGIGAAVQRGYRYALKKKYRYAVQFDGDGQHGIEYIFDLIGPLEKGDADMVIGSRFQGLVSYYRPGYARRTGIRLISLIIERKTGVEIKDPTSGYRAVGRKIMRMFAEDYPAKYPEPETCARILLAGLRVVEVPVRMHRRKGGQSSINSWRTVDYMIRVIASILKQNDPREIQEDIEE